MNRHDLINGAREILRMEEEIDTLRAGLQRIHEKPDTILDFLSDEQRRAAFAAMRERFCVACGRESAGICHRENDE